MLLLTDELWLVNRCFFRVDDSVECTAVASWYRQRLRRLTLKTVCRETCTTAATRSGADHDAGGRECERGTAFWQSFRFCCVCQKAQFVLG
jgi:hypothetical protein